MRIRRPPSGFDALANLLAVGLIGKYLVLRPILGEIRWKLAHRHRRR